MKINSFFCGAGGFDLGFLASGFKILKAWDVDRFAVKSYKHNIGNHVEQKDIQEMKGEDVPNALGWLFGFPCTDISQSGKRAGMIKGKTRTGLFYEVMRLLEEVKEKPMWILAENVKNVDKLIPIIREEYEKVGYRLVEPQLYNTRNWGIPHNRERYFLLGIRNDLDINFNFPEQPNELCNSLKEFIHKDVDKKYYVNAAKAKEIIDNSGIDIESRGMVTGVYHGKKGFKEIDFSYCLDANYYKGILNNQERTGVIDTYGVRRLSPRECAILQGFPNTYEQVVSDSQFYKQMGNAVTVKVSEIIANAIKEQIHNKIN